MKNCKFCQSPTKNLYCSFRCGNYARKAKNVSKYNTSPKLCKLCSVAIEYDKRHINVYCSSACAAKANNSLYPKRIKKEKPNKTTWLERKLPHFLIGEISNRSSLRKLLVQTKGNRCNICKMDAIWQNQRLTLIVDHINGNAGNNLPANLRLLCPNCNSQTPTFCGRNLGKGRQSLGLPKN